MWILVAILAYSIFAAVFLVDKHLLTQKIPSAKIYSFFVGLLGGGAIVLIPFVDFSLPSTSQIILALTAGALNIFSLFWFYRGLKEFEASRIVPAVTGILPVFTFLITFFISRGAAVPDSRDFLAFLILILGSVLITKEDKGGVSFASLKVAGIAAFFFAFSFVLMKYVYLAQSFWSGFIWMRMGGVIAAFLFFVALGEERKSLFSQKSSLSKKTGIIFVANQGFGAAAGILQNWAIALAPLVYLAIINALQGVQYVFLLIFTTLLSIAFPQILKEEISKKIILRKALAILIIGAGLAMITLQ